MLNILNYFFEKKKSYKKELEYITNYNENLNLIIKLLMYIETLVNKLNLLKVNEYPEIEYYQNEIITIIDNINNNSLKNKFNVDENIIIDEFNFECYIHSLLINSSLLTIDSITLQKFDDFEIKYFENSSDITINDSEIIIIDDDKEIILNKGKIQDNIEIKNYIEIKNIKHNLKKFTISDIKDLIKKKSYDYTMYILYIVKKKLINKIIYYQQKIILLKYYIKIL